MKQAPVMSVVKSFFEPLLIILGILFFLLFSFLHMRIFAHIVIVGAIVLGSYDLFIDIMQKVSKRQYALDYIAALAIVVSFATADYLVCAIIALMIASGRNLEEYGVSKAKKSLTLLASRIPQEVLLSEKGQVGEKVPVNSISIGQEIFIRSGEVIPLDGTLVSGNGQTDESSLTGEPYFIDKLHGDILRSGTINAGSPFIIRVNKAEKDSTYHKILAMVEKAQTEKAPLVRLADQYSTYFTFTTIGIAALGYFFAGGLEGVLAVLVVATPCPLILATPIALLGGINAGAKKRIIIKKLASLETVNRITAIVFDKTGTITMGRPQVKKITLRTPTYTIPHIMQIASAIERNSLHPLAKAIVGYAKEAHLPPLGATNVSEMIGKGIRGTVEGKEYTLQKAGRVTTGLAIGLLHEGKTIATIHLVDEIKQSSKQVIAQLKKENIALSIFTGDKKAEADRITRQLDSFVTVHAGMSPDEKQKGIQLLQHKGNIVAMLGDGINDAPALASADVGLVFSNDEQTAASEAADIVLLGGDFELIRETILISQRTISIALQSIRWGIGLSIFCMLLASFGYIPPLVGAGIQEGIDVAVILNALRASRS